MFYITFTNELVREALRRAARSPNFRTAEIDNLFGKTLKNQLIYIKTKLFVEQIFD